MATMEAEWREVRREDVGWKRKGARFWIREAETIQLAVLYEEDLPFAAVYNLVTSASGVKCGWRSTSEIVKSDHLPAGAESHPLPMGGEPLSN